MLKKGNKRIPLSFYPYFFLITMIIFFGICKPRSFFSLRNFEIILLHSSTLTISTIALIPVIITGSISLSTGAIFGLSGLAAVMFTKTYDPLIGLVSGILVGAAVGSMEGLLFIKLKIPSFILTLGTMTVIRGIILIWSQGMSVYSSSSFGFLGSFPTIFYISLAILVFAYIIYNFMPFGWHLRAIGNNEEASNLAGISVNKIKFLAFLWCGILMGISGVLSSYRMSAATPTMGIGYELTIISASVLGGVPLTGGIGRIEGALVGSLVISILENGLIMLGVGPEFHELLMGLVLIIAVSTMFNRELVKSIK